MFVCIYCTRKLRVDETKHVLLESFSLSFSFPLVKPHIQGGFSTTAREKDEVQISHHFTPKMGARNWINLTEPSEVSPKKDMHKVKLLLLDPFYNGRRQSKEIFFLHKAPPTTSTEPSEVSLRNAQLEQNKYPIPKLGINTILKHKKTHINPQ